METLREESAGPLEVLPSLPEDALQVRVARLLSSPAAEALPPVTI